MMGIVYFIVIFLACMWGAIVGLGGGVFIRPIFDAIGHHDVLNIQFLASSAIITMALVSTYRKVKDNVKIEFKVALLVSLGAVAGGMGGDSLLQFVLGRLGTDAAFQQVQNIGTIIVLSICIFLATKRELRCVITNKFFALLLGVGMGVIAVFLGIGGGPVNVPLLMIFLGLPMKQAAAYSIVIIFFSHLSRIVNMGITVGFGEFDLRYLLFAIPAAALGGIVGAVFSQKFSEKLVHKLFIIALLAVIALNIYNGVMLVLA